MDNVLLFPITLVFCFGICILSAKERSEVDLIISQAGKESHTPASEEPHFNRSETEVARADAECSDKRPCQNGGTCSYNRRCLCPPGTSGTLCEEIRFCPKCKNRLEADCLYDQGREEGYCSCKNSSLYYDYGANICRPCPCENADCEYEYTSTEILLKCNCHFGYKEFNGDCKKCECDFRARGECGFDSEGERICKCPNGYYERNGLCLLCGCTMYSDLETKCEMTGNVKLCYCKEGFQDVNGHCEDINECETNNTCHPSTTCYNTFGSFYCECPDGYKGTEFRRTKPGKACEDIDECKQSPSSCWKYDNVKCVNLPGSYKCECLHGYEPLSYSYEPHKTTCISTRKHWGPAVIVVCTTLILIGVLVLMHKRVKSRAPRAY